MFPESGLNFNALTINQKPDYVLFFTFLNQNQIIWGLHKKLLI